MEQNMHTFDSVQSFTYCKAYIESKSITKEDVYNATSFNKLNQAKNLSLKKDPDCLPGAGLSLSIMIN